MTRAALALALVLAACGSSPSTTGSIKDVTVVLKGSSTPLPFDPRGGRITAVTREIAELVGHPIVLELDTALSPELKASLEETVLASFETIARELVRLKRDDPDMFARARRIERVVCTYDAVIRASSGKLEKGGTVLAVRSPPDRWPLLERGIFSDAVYFAHVAELDARWGEADPTKLSPSEQARWLAYMLSTRPGAGNLWVAERAKKGRSWEGLRAEHLERILRLSAVATAPTDKRVRTFLAGSMAYAGSLKRDKDERVDPALARRVFDAYEAWLVREAPAFDDGERYEVVRAIFEDSAGVCRGHGCPTDALFPRFDIIGFALSIYDAWVREGAKLDPGEGQRAEVYQRLLGPTARRGEAETEIHLGKSVFFERAFADETLRSRLADAIRARRDKRLLELALLNLGYKNGPAGVAFAELMARDAELFRHTLSVLFYDHARRDDVRHALEEAAPRWWRDAPDRRGFVLLVVARKHDDLHVHYADNQWTRFAAEYGGPITRDVFEAYLREGPRAIEMAPKLWPALPKGPMKSELIAAALPTLIARDAADRTTRARATLGLLRTRLCADRDAAGMALVRAAVERAARSHPEQQPNLSNALVDLTPARCGPSAADRY